MQPVEHQPDRQAPAPAPRFRRLLPDNGAIDHAAFAARRRVIAYILLAHLPLLLGFSLFTGVVPVQSVLVSAPAPILLAVLGLVFRKRSHAALVLATGLVWCSTALLHLTEGAVAANAHALLVVAACALLQEWSALTLAITALTVSHGALPVVGPLVPAIASATPGGIVRTWPWGVLHLAFLIAVATPSIVSWKALEGVQDRAAELAWEASNAAHKADRRRAQSMLALSLSRRNQTLLEQQLELLDVLELDEADPEALAGLFRLDHLATRMRRNAESLLVMSGDEPPRWQGAAAPLSEVVRAAVGEVEQFTRVEVMLTEDPLVAGSATADLTHLLAELIDNATTFSARSSLVVVSGQATSDGYELRVKDRGRGMTEQALHERNRQLAHPPDLDLEFASMIGLHVCARLAQRLAVGVALERNANAGTTASVIIPSILLSNQAAPVRRVLAAALAALGADEDEDTGDEDADADDDAIREVAAEEVTRDHDHLDFGRPQVASLEAS